MVVLLKEEIYTREVYRKQGENRVPGVSPKMSG
jgi:hypothetical protein